MELSERARSMTYAATAELKLIAETRRAMGGRVIDLGIGEVKFGFPAAFARSIGRAAARGEDQYTHAAGTIDVRRSLARAHNSGYFCATTGRTEKCLYRPTDIVHGISAKFLITLTAMTVADPGDGIMVIDPSWPLYAGSLQAVGLRPIRAKTTFTDRFTPRIDILRDSWTPQTRALILNSPNNPTGRVYTRTELEDILTFALERDLLIISDEVYDSIVFDNHCHISIASLNDKAAEQTVVVKSLSKTYGMGGLRFGYALSRNARLVDALTKLVSNTITCSPSLVQSAVPALLRRSSHVTRIRDSYAERTVQLSDAFARLGIPCHAAEGTPFLFPYVGSVYGGELQTSVDVTYRLLDEESIVALPGSTCGNDDHIRIALIEETPILLEAAERIAQFLERYHP